MSKATEKVIGGPMRRLVRLNGCRIIKDGVTYHCRWKTGFKNHCLIMLRGWSPGTTWATSGNAEVALDPADFCVRQPNDQVEGPPTKTSTEENQ